MDGLREDTEQKFCFAWCDAPKFSVFCRCLFFSLLMEGWVVISVRYWMQCAIHVPGPPWLGMHHAHGRTGQGRAGHGMASFRLAMSRSSLTEGSAQRPQVEREEEMMHMLSFLALAAMLGLMPGMCEGPRTIITP